MMGKLDQISKLNRGGIDASANFKAEMLEMMKGGSKKQSTKKKKSGWFGFGGDSEPE